MDFGDLKDDKSVQEKILNVNASVTKIDKLLEVAMNSNVYDTLELSDKISYDLFITYTLNTLYWLYLRTKGVDPNTNEVKSELSRIREYMLKAKQVEDRSLRPKVDAAAAKRFVKHGIGKTGDDGPQGKKRRFDDTE